MARRDDGVVEPGPAGPAIEDEGLRGKGGELDCVVTVSSSPAQPVPLGQREQHLFVEQRVDDEPGGIGDRRADEGGVDALVAQALDHVGGPALLQH